MASANVEIVKRFIDAYNRRDVEALAGLVTPDFEFFAAMIGVVEGGSYRGREGMEAYFKDIGDTWEVLRVLGDEFRDLGDRVLWLGRAEGRGKGSGVPVDAPLGAVSDFRDGKISRARAFLDHGEALRAAGLSE